jgi:perosamine synthetase
MSSIPLTRESLAIHGGPPVRQTFLPYGHQSIEERDIQAVVEALRSDWLTTGPRVEEFENVFAHHVGAKYAVSFSSGTAALHAAAFAAGLGPGDEAITTPLTFAATANCVLYQGAKPIFSDVSPDTLNLDPDQVRARITPRTKAILAVDYAGHPADLDAFLKLADQHGLVLIEDACHALGAEYRGRKVGSLLHMTVFSFHPVKHLTTGEGGMVTTESLRYAETLRRFRNHGISSEARQRESTGRWHYDMVLLGFNYRLPDIACALGLSQIERLTSNLQRRRQIAARYTSIFRNMPCVIAPSVRDDVNPAWHLYPIRVVPDQLCAARDEIIGALRAENIGANVHYPPVHLHSYYRKNFGYKRRDYPIAETASEQLISLPIFQAMTEKDVQDVIEAVEKINQCLATQD